MPDRLLLSNENFFSVPKAAINKGVIYPGAEAKLARFCKLFGGDQVELFLAIRDPATFLPAVYAQAPDMDFLDFMSGSDPRDIRWSELIARLRAAVPGVAITVWCNEDTPLIWTELLRALAGHDPQTELEGSYDFLATIMSPAGLARMKTYLESHPLQNELQRRRVVAAFLDKYAIEDEVEIELDLPGWTEDLVEEMTEAYEEDLFEIERMEGVRFITP